MGTWHLRFAVDVSFGHPQEVVVNTGRVCIVLRDSLSLNPMIMTLNAQK
jgi:hypothetical protein